ncbi:MAG: 30S ribosomal protein S20 [Candidatus Cloacimonadales bacterium]
MPNSKSPEKRLRQETKRAARNHYVKKTLSTLDKKMHSNITLEEKQELISTIFSKLDKAAKNNVIHKRTASRRKARISAYLAKEHKINAE